MHYVAHTQYSVVENNDVKNLEQAQVQVLKNPHGLKWSAFLGVLGIPGKSEFIRLRINGRSFAFVSRIHRILCLERILQS